MANVGMNYPEEEWQGSCGHRPLKDPSNEQLYLLHRHWMWSNQQREAFEMALANDAESLKEMNLAHRAIGFMCVWYALLYSVIEAMKTRNLDLRSVLASDIKAVVPTLKEFRNAVFHVSWSSYYDDRIFAVFNTTLSSS
jgi:hypothetical protein